MTDSDRTASGKGDGAPKTSGGPNGPKGPNWTLERIRLLTDEEVKSLKANAERRGNHEVAQMCDVVLLERHPQKSIMEGKHPRAKRTSQDREEQKAAVELLLGLASELSSKYDLSDYSLLGKTGKPKVGGNQIKGLLNFNQYISYGTNDEVFSLLIWKSPEVGGPHYEIGAPEKYLKNPKPVKSGSDLPLGPFIGRTKFSESFESFGAAANAYRNIIQTIAKAV